MKLLLPLLLSLAQCLRADDVGPYFDPSDAESYELNYGYYPYHSYQSFDLVGPAVKSYTHASECDDGRYTFLTPRGYSIGRPGNVIMDNQGELVWAKDTFGQAYDLMVQEYKGEKYLSYWVGDDRIRGHGSGDYFMINSSYDEAFKISATNGLAADLHEMYITPQGTALLTVYQTYQKDLSAMKWFDIPEDDEEENEDDEPNWIWDCLFQEIDIATNELLFQWRASDHHSFGESYRDIGDQGTKGDPWDWYHINSVQRDDLGNYIVSARYTHTVTYIDGKTGGIIWILGGKRNNFKDLSQGNATDFAWQHDARFHSLERFPELFRDAIAEQKSESSNSGQTTRLVTLFDNAADDFSRSRETSRGLLLELRYPTSATSPYKREASVKNDDAWTVRLVQSYDHPETFVASSQGSLQVLASPDSTKDSKVLVGYGYNALWTEFAGNGTLLCDNRFATNYSWGRGDVQSYRTFKYDWIGRPAYPPSAVLAEDGGAVYVSWNGATEVKTWILQESASIAENSEQWRELVRAPKQRFETEMEIDEETVQRYLRVLALDADGQTIGVSETVDNGWPTGLVRAMPAELSSSATPLNLFLLFVFNIAALYGLYELYRKFCCSGRRGRKNSDYHLLSPTLSDV